MRYLGGLTMSSLKVFYRYGLMARLELFCLLITVLMFGCSSPYSKDFGTGSYAMRGDHDSIINECNNIIEKNPKDTLAYYSRGVAYTHKQQYNNAIEDFDKVLSMNKQYIASNLSKPNTSNISSEFNDFVKTGEANRVDQTAIMSGKGMAGALAGTPGLIQPDRSEQLKAKKKKEDAEILITWNALKLRAMSSKERAESFEKAGRIPEALEAYTEYIRFYKRLEPKQQKQEFVNEAYRFSLGKIEELKLNKK
jgi:tetratricopeptide (TPR) repeat protein